MVTGPLRTAALFLLALLACAGGRHAEVASHAPVHEAHAPAEPNRDPHGPADVERYIRGLESAERLRHLRPDLVVESLKLPTDAIVADLGSGPGAFTLPLARACPEGIVYAVDVEPRQLDALRERVARARIANVVPVLAGHDDPFLPPLHIDLILIVDTYHHLSDRVAYFERLRRALRPGGRLAIVEAKPGDLPVGPPAHHKLPEGTRPQELRAAGWRLVERLDTHAYHDFEIWSSASGATQ
jgi:SAM-dependent methyltransferase